MVSEKPPINPPQNALFHTVLNPVNANLLFMNASLVTPRRKHATFIPLEDAELPQRDDVVGLNAEFVTLNQVRLYENNVYINICNTQPGPFVRK